MSFVLKPKMEIDRRTLLVGGGIGAGLLIAWRIWPRDQSINLAVRDDETALGAFLKIGTDNRVTVAVPKAEMGQGVWTGRPQILAHEPRQGWPKMGVEQAANGPAYANDMLQREQERRTPQAWGGTGGGRG